MRTRARRIHFVVLGIAASLAVAACGGATSDGSTTIVPPAAGSTTTSSPDTTAVASTTTAAPSTTTGDLPGDEVDFFFQEGDVIAVIGVESDDVLNVRSGPGVGSPIVAELEPTADDVVANGHTRSLDDNSFWTEVTVDDTVGWASVIYLAYLGLTDDITSQVVDANGGDVPAAETMLDLGMLVAGTRASTEEPVSAVTVTVDPTVGDLGEITIDVVGLGDDAIRGERLHVFGTPDDSGDGFSLMSVERTVLCSRGASDEGFCN